MPGRTPSVPRLFRHKGRSRGCCKVNGKFVYFRGPWPAGRKTPPPEIQQQYDQWLARFLAVRGNGRPTLPPEDPTIDELWLAYLQHCESYYRKNGRPTSEVQSVKDACRVAARLFGEEPAREFTPRKLKLVREEFVRLGWARGHVNKQVSRVRRMFRWGVGEELVPAFVLHNLREVPDIPKGRDPRLRETEPVRPVAWETVEKTLPFLPPTLADLVRFHWHVGCRAGEACVLHADDLRTGTVPWCWFPRAYKTQHLEDPGAEPPHYWIGPRARQLLTPLLEVRGGWLFPSGRTRGPGHWTTSSYRRAVKRAAAKAGAPHWHPLQVRHAHATRVRRGHERGVEAAQAALNHREVTTAQIYAERLDELARDVAERMG